MERAPTASLETTEPTVTAAPESPYFAGVPPEIRNIGQLLGTGDVAVNLLVFEAGTRSRPHVHTRDQVLYYARGTGVVALGGGEDQLIGEGEFVLLPAGVIHMHGASDDGPAVHISITADIEIDWDCPVPDSWRRWLP